MQDEERVFSARLMLLTPREVELLRWVALGYTREQVMWHMGITKKTYYNHRANALMSLEVNSMINALRCVGWLRVPGDLKS
jgi:DNA-binding CsgD family transcriptional regulator